MTTDLKDMMAKKVQAAARGYITRKTGLGKKAHKAGAGKKTGSKKTGGNKKNKDDDMQAQVIQAAFRKYKEYSSKKK